MRPSPQEVQDMFEVVCVPSRSNPNFYGFSDNGLASHTEEECKLIIEMCMILDQRPSDLITGKLIHAIADRIATIEEALDNIRPVLGRVADDA